MKWLIFQILQVLRFSSYFNENVTFLSVFCQLPKIKKIYHFWAFSNHVTQLSSDFQNHSYIQYHFIQKNQFFASWNVTELAFFHEHVQTKKFQKAIVKYFIEIRNLQDNKHFCHIWCSRVFKTQTKISIVNVWLGYKYASVIKFWPWIKFCMRCLNFIILRA